MGAALAGFACFFAAHAALHRLRPSNDPRIAAALAFGALGLCVAAATSGRDAVAACAAAWFYFAAFILYLFVYAGLARSVSVTLLERLALASGGATLDDLSAEYEGSSRFEDRLALMSSEGLIRLSAGTATLTAKGRALARAARFLGSVLGGGMEG